MRMRKFEFIAEGRVATAIMSPSTWPDSELGKTVRIIQGRWAQNDAQIVSIKRDYHPLTGQSISFELHVLFSKRIPQAADMTTHMTEEEYKRDCFAW